MNSHEQLVRDMTDGRLVNISESLLFPMFQKHLKQRVDEMCGKFRAGETNLLADIATIAYIRDVVRELEVKQARGNFAVKQLHEEEKADGNS